MLDYAYVLTIDLKKKLEGKKLYKRAADYCDEYAIKEYIKYLEDGSFGIVFADQAKKYREILSYYGVEVDKVDSPKVSIYPSDDFQKLNKQCRDLVKEAESGDKSSLVSVAQNLIDGSNSFPTNVQLGIKYLDYGIEHNNVECMEIYGKMLLEGNKIQKDEEKALSILTKAANDFQSDESRILIVKNIMGKGDRGEKVNYVLAKKYAKKVAENGNVEAYVLYGRLCEKRVTNKYGTIEQSFEEAFKYFKLAYERGDADGTAWYAYYLANPHGLFMPDIKQSVELTKIAADKGSAYGIARLAAHNLNGISMPKDTKEGWRLMKIALDKDSYLAMFFFGLGYYYGSYDMPEDENKGLKYIKKAALRGNDLALLEYAKLADKYPDKIDVSKIRKKLIENGFIFTELMDSDIEDGENIIYEACVSIKNKDYDKGISLLKQAIDKNYICGLRLYADILTTELDKPEEGQRMYKKACNYRDLYSTKDYVQYYEEGRFGKVDPDEIRPYKEILGIYKDFIY